MAITTKVCVCVCVCVYIYIHTHTHTHTQTDSMRENLHGVGCFLNGLNTSRATVHCVRVRTTTCPKHWVRNRCFTTSVHLNHYEGDFKIWSKKKMWTTPAVEVNLEALISTIISFRFIRLWPGLSLCLFVVYLSATLVCKCIYTYMYIYTYMNRPTKIKRHPHFAPIIRVCEQKFRYMVCGSQPSSR